MQLGSIIKVPFFTKVSHGYCGLASLQMILARYGIERTQEAIATHLRPTTKGVECDHLEMYAKATGLRVVRERHLGIRGAVAAIDRGIAPLLLGQRHAFVLCGYNRQTSRYSIHDPDETKGYQEINKQRLEYHWQRIAPGRNETDALLISRFE